MRKIDEIHFEGKIAQKAIVVRDDLVLLIRDPRESNEVWELPGGRMNLNEAPRAALARELKEELGVDFDIHEIIHTEQFFQTNEGKQAFVIVYRATERDITAEFVPAPKEVSHLEWFSHEALDGLKLFPEYRRALELFLDRE